MATCKCGKAIEYTAPQGVGVCKQCLHNRAVSQPMIELCDYRPALPTVAEQVSLLESALQHSTSYQRCLHDYRNGGFSVPIAQWLFDAAAYYERVSIH